MEAYIEPHKYFEQTKKLLNNLKASWITTQILIATGKKEERRFFYFFFERRKQKEKQNLSYTAKNISLDLCLRNSILGYSTNYIKCLLANYNNFFFLKREFLSLYLVERLCVWVNAWILWVFLFKIINEIKTSNLKIVIKLVDLWKRVLGLPGVCRTQFERHCPMLRLWC